MNDKAYAEFLEIKKTIIELSAANKSLTQSLKKEIKKNEKLQQELNETANDLSFYKESRDKRWNKESLMQSEIDNLKENMRITAVERNLLLRKIKLEACECEIKSQEKPISTTIVMKSYKEKEDNDSVHMSGMSGDV